MRILLVGLPASGKTFLSRALARHLGLPVLRVDDQRRLIGDGTVAGEYAARSAFLSACGSLDDVIVETAGLGTHRVALRQALASRFTPLLIATVWCDEALRVERLGQRHVDVPHPDWGLAPTWGAERQAATLREDVAGGFWAYRPGWRHVEVRGDDDVEAAIASILAELGDAATGSWDSMALRVATTLGIGVGAVHSIDLRATTQADRPSPERAWEVVTPEVDGADIARLAASFVDEGRRVVFAPAGARMWNLVVVESDERPRISVRIPHRRDPSAVDWLARFVERMERAAATRGASDAWAWFTEATEALEALMRGWWSARTGQPIPWGSPMPPVRGLLPPALRKAFRDVAPGLDLAESGQDADRLLAFAEALTDDLGDRPEAAFLGTWLPSLRWAAFVRDGLWNFRDVARLSDGRLRGGVLFRGSSPARYAGGAEASLFESWLDATRVRVAVDLREVGEAGARSYIAAWPDRLRYVPTPFDWTPRDGAARSTHEAEYVRLFEDNRHAIHDALEHVALGDDAVLVHCHAGMDRTGVVVAIAGLLCGLPREVVVSDYLASGGTTVPHRMHELLDHLDRRGGVSELAVNLGLSDQVVGRLRARLLRTQAS